MQIILSSNVQQWKSCDSELVQIWGQLTFKYCNFTWWRGDDDELAPPPPAVELGGEVILKGDPPPPAVVTGAAVVLEDEWGLLKSIYSTSVVACVWRDI